MNEVRCWQHLIDYTECDVCPSKAESIFYILRECIHNIEIWSKMAVQNFMPDFFNCTDEVWWCQNLSCVDKRDGNIPLNLIFCYTSWFLWKWRNHRIFQNGEGILRDKYASITRFMISYDKNWSPEALIVGQQSNVSWVGSEKPPNNWVTLYTDGCCDSLTGKIRVGGAIRDQWQIGFIHNIGLGHSLLAEAWAFLTGQVAASRNFNSVIIESDSLELVNSLNGQMTTDSSHPLWNLLFCIHRVLRSFSQVQVKHVFREANYVADLLAKLAISAPLGLDILEHPPRCCDSMFVE